MALDDFTTIIPPGWTAVDDSVVDGWGRTSILDAVTVDQHGECNNMLEAAGLLPEGKEVTQARMLPSDTSLVLHLWVKFTDIV